MGILYWPSGIAGVGRYCGIFFFLRPFFFSMLWFQFFIFWNVYHRLNYSNNQLLISQHVFKHKMKEQNQHAKYFVETPFKKNSTQTIFQGVAHDQHWSSIVCLLWWTSVVYSFFLKCFFFQNPFLISFATACVPYLVQLSWHPLLDFYGVSMEFL